MSYERDTDAHLKGVGTIAAAAGKRPRADARRRARSGVATRQRDRRMAAMTMGPGGGLMGLGMVKLPTFGRTGTAMAPVLTAGGVVEGGGMIGGGGAVNTGGTFGSGGGGGGVSPTNGGKSNVFATALNAVRSGVLQPLPPPAYVGICVDAAGNKIPCPPPASGGPVWNPSSGIVPPTLPPSDTSITTNPNPMPPVQITGGGGGGSGISTDPVPLPPIDVPPPTSLPPVPEDGGLSALSTNTKIALGVGAAALAYFLFKKGG